MTLDTQDTQTDTAVDATQPSSEGDRFPFRSFWVWPLVFAGVTLVELISMDMLTLGNLGALLLALSTAATGGLFVGVLGLSLSHLLRHRLDPLRATMVGFLEPLTGAFTFGVLVTLIGHLAADPVLYKALSMNFDFAEDQHRLAKTALIFGTAPFVLLSFAVVRALSKERTLTQNLLFWRIGASTLGLIGVSVLTNKLYFNYIPNIALFMIVTLSAVAIAPWLPASLKGARRGAMICLAPALLLLMAGVFGAQWSQSRALLLHDARFAPALLDVITQVSDMDGDGVGARWAGGDDCDDGNPLIAPNQVEIPGNGLDDNCSGGDGRPYFVPTRPVSGEVELNPWPIFLISIDTLRNDHLSSQGYPRATTPFMTGFVKERCLSFERAYSPSNRTEMSMMSMFAGQSPEFIIQKTNQTNQNTYFSHWLPHTLNKIGFETIAFNPMFAEMNLTFEESRFAKSHVEAVDYAPVNHGTRSAQIRHWVTRWLLERPDKAPPVFAWIHLDDPHAHHEAEGPFSGTTRLNDAYDNEIFFTDYQLKKIIARIDQKYAKSVIIITSDHGEDFGERGILGHGHSLYESQVRVPLYVCAPGVKPGVRQDVVSNAAIPATVLELIGHPGHPRLQAPSLLHKSEDTGVTVYNPFFGVERRMEAALIEERYKLIYNRSRGTYQLFDLSADPAERHNLVGQRPEITAQMKDKLQSRLETLR